MPTYTYRCKQCCHEFDIVHRMSDDSLTDCEQCGGELRRVIGLPMIAPDITPYQSMLTGEMIGSRSEHREHLRKHGYVEVGDQMSKRQQQYKETEFEQKLDWHKKKGKPLPPESVRDTWSKEH